MGESYGGAESRKMGTRFTQESFTRGELTPRLDSRTTLEQYSIGLKTAKNAILHQEGGISNRMGLEYVGIAKYSNKQTRVIKFVFNSEQTNMLEFGDKYIRVIKDGEYVTYPEDYGVDEGIETVYDDEYESVVFWEDIWGYVRILENPDALEPDYIAVYFDTEDYDTEKQIPKIGTSVYKEASHHQGFSDYFGYISAIDTDEQTITIVKDYSNNDEDKIALQGEIVEIETPYDANDLVKIKKSQSGDIITLTHPDYPTYNLARYSHCDWKLEPITFEAVISAPTNVSATFSTTTPSSNTKTYSYVVTAVDEATNTESERSEVVEVVAHREANWTTSEYITITCDEVFGASEYNIYRNVNGIYGYSGTAQVTDEGVTVQNNVKWSNKTTSVNRYTGNTITSITLADSTVIYTNETFAKGAKFYTDYSCATFYATCTALTNTSKNKKITLVKRGVRFVDDNIEPDLSSSAPVRRNPFDDGNYSSCSAYYQQRKMFANSNSSPQTLWATQSGTVNNFNVSRPLVATDAVTLNMDDREVNEIRHMVPMKDLIVLTSNSEWKVNGTDGIFQANPMPAAVIQSCYGSSHVEPVVSGSMILFVQAGGSVIRDLGYDIMSDSYDGDELSIFSSHLFEGKEVKYMAYAKEPYRILYVVFTDGSCVTMCYNKKQKLCGWTRFVTDGTFESVDVVREGLEDVAYFVINRTINNQNVKFIERTRTRIFDNMNNAFLVDCGKSQTFEEPITTISGIDWLEGKQIVVNADGGIIEGLTVENGQVTLPQAATNIILGLPYEFEIETMNIEGENTQGLKKIVNYVSAKIYKSREDFIFVNDDNTGYVNQRCYESLEDDTRLFSKDIASTVLATAKTNATIKIRQPLPLPLTILSISGVIDVQDNENA